MHPDYGKGYNAGRRNSWPLHVPPMPPHPIVAEIVQAGKALRDETDAICATFMPDDELVLKLDPKIEAFDDALSKISEWLARAQQGKP